MKKFIKEESGMALMLVMMFTVAMGIVVGFAAIRAHYQDIHTDYEKEQLDVFQTMESAMSIVENSVQIQLPLATKTNGVVRVGVSDAYDFAAGEPEFGDGGVNPLQVAGMPHVEYFAYAMDWSSDGIDNDGDGAIDVGGIEEDGYHSVYAYARVVLNNGRDNGNGPTTFMRGSEQIMREGDPINIWDNAIFAGTGQAGNLINGNVSIHGSVHLLGTDLGAGGVAIAALDLSGTSMIHNNYEGITADLAGRVPALPQTNFDGELVDTLEASLRVQNGLVGMSGNSEVGEPQQLGNAYKETMDGVFVNDGWTGNDMDGNGDPQSVFSDNGWDESYDMGAYVPFPTFDDDNGRDHLAYYQENVIPLPGDMSIESGGDNYYYNATTGELVEAGTPGDGSMPLKADLDPDANYIWYDGANKTMVINGRVPVDGNIEILAGSGAANKLIDYEGQGTLLAFDADDSGDGGDVTLDTSLKTTSFPNTNLIGIMAENDYYLGASSQIEIMGGFYAQEGISVDKQTTIMGTIVGDYFNMGTNVPDIYQVPELMDAWTAEQRMIGADPMPGPVTPLVWREIGA
jgi:hypothetical protein